MSSPSGMYLVSSAQPSKNGKLGVGAILVGGAVVALLLVGTCGRSTYHSYKAADSAVGHFHEQLDGSEYEEIYSDATDEFRNASSRQQQIGFLKMVHDKMGNSGKRSIQGFHVTASTKGSFVNVVYQTEFVAGPVKEYFVWRMDQEHPRLWGYHIDSPDMR